MNGNYFMNNWKENKSKKSLMNEESWRSQDEVEIVDLK